MSHELRTPLNSLLILAEQLADDPDHNMDNTQIEYAGVILASGRDLLGLLNTILDLAKVESGTATVELATMSVGQLHDDMIRELEHVAGAKGIGFSIDQAADLPADIVTDPQRLRQILKNLISNAFKFTELGHVELRIARATSGWNRELASLENAASVLAFAVHDTGIGIGIEEQQQRRIFEAFAQGDGTTVRLYGGTGLGLSISRELVAMLGGEITLSSTLGKGSTFTVFLPLIPATSAAPLAVVEIAPTADRVRHNGLDDRPFEGCRILVIDDDFRNVFALTALLERGHADVTVSESGPDALAILEQTPEIDLVLTDIMMPDMDGYDTIRAVRAIERFRTVPILAITGKVVPGERQRCIDAGADDYVPKPISGAQLIAAIGPWLPANCHTRQRATP